MKKVLLVLPFLSIACAPVPQNRISERISEVELKLTRLEQKQEDLEKEVEDTNRRIDRVTEMISDLRLELERIRLRLEVGERRELTGTAEDVRKIPPPKDLEVIRPGEEREEDEETAYRKAIELYSVKKLYEARDAFLNFIKRFPDSRYTDNAFFWIGRIYYELGDLERAEGVFKTLVEKCEGKKLPDCNKLPDAYYQLMRINVDRGNVEEANRYYSLLIERFPTSEAAIKAREQKTLMGE